MESWVELLKTFGLAVMIIFSGGWGLWKIIVWTGNEIVVPIRDALVAGLNEQLKQISDHAKERTIERQSRHEIANAFSKIQSEAEIGFRQRVSEVLDKLETVCKYQQIGQTNRRGPQQRQQNQEHRDAE